MKIIITLVALVILHGIAVCGIEMDWEQFLRQLSIDDDNDKHDEITTEWITQKLDHFGKKNKKTWKMRYMANEKYYEKGGPIFIYVGGEWTIKPKRIRTSIIVDLAKEHKGILFVTEHRFYGKSQPTDDLSIANLRYLHSRQALADLNHFIRYKRRTDKRLSDSKVILVGCSYSASLAVWFNEYYPNVVDGTWASSAPLLGLLNFKRYYEIIGKALRKFGSPECYMRIQNGIAELEEMFGDEHSAAAAKAMLNLCKKFDHKNDLNLWDLFESIAAIFGHAVQTQRGNDIPELCDTLLSAQDDVSSVIATFVNKHTIDKDKCIGTAYHDDIGYYKNETFYSNSRRPWLYQMCNEFGWFKTSDSENQPFSSFPLDLFIQICSDSFGNRYTKAKMSKLISNNNKMYDGRNPNVKNVYMTYGLMDPWNTLGPNKTLGARGIPNVSHCADFSSISKDDSKEMRATKERLKKLVRQWLA